MLLFDIVSTSRRVRETRSRSEKVRQAVTRRGTLRCSGTASAKAAMRSPPGRSTIAAPSTERQVAQAAGVPVEEIRLALMVSGKLGAAARAALIEGRPGLARLAIGLFRPLKPMLAQTAENNGQALLQLGTAAFEYKLDGARIQVHKDGRDVRVFSRYLNDVTVAVPEVVEAVRELDIGSVILDDEAIACQPDGRPRPIQVTFAPEHSTSAFFLRFVSGGPVSQVSRARVRSGLGPAALRRAMPPSGAPNPELTVAEVDAIPGAARPTRRVPEKPALPEWLAPAAGPSVRANPHQACGQTCTSIEPKPRLFQRRRSRPAMKG